MAKISSFLYCSDVTVNQDTPKPQIGDILEVITPNSIPGNFSFSLIFGILELGKSKKLKVKFVDPKGVISLETDELDLTNGENNDLSLQDDEKNYETVYVVLDLINVDLPLEGIYNTEVIVEESVIGEFPIPVINVERVRNNELNGS